MDNSLTSRLKHAWNAFVNNERPRVPTGPAYSFRPDRHVGSRGNERSIINAIYNRISMDCAQISIKHVDLDDKERYINTRNSSFNNCLTVEANIDQTGRAFIQDVVHSMLDEGCVAIVPTKTTENPLLTASYDIGSLRSAKIIEWYPREVKVRIYNDVSGKYDEMVFPKTTVAIIENPFYSVMNGPNSTLQRLIRKLNLLDIIDEQSGAGKLDLIIQLPYIVRNETKRRQAEERRKQIEEQLAGSKYGIAYADGTEKIVQLNRSVDNNLMNQIEYLMRMLYSQLGITEEIMNGTAKDTDLTNYYNRVVEPIMSAIVDEMKRKFLSKTARSQRQSVCFFRDPFKLVPVNQLPDLVDKFTRNEIMTSNECRQIVGLTPSEDPGADELRNKNLSKSNEEIEAEVNGFEENNEETSQ